jgi:hypothetical protein
VLLVLAMAEVAQPSQAWPIVKTCRFHLLIFVTQGSVSFCHNFPTLTPSPISPEETPWPANSSNT